MDLDRQTDILGNGHIQTDKQTYQAMCKGGKQTYQAIDIDSCRQTYQAMDKDRQTDISGHGHRQLDRPTRQWTQTARQTFKAMCIDR